jgi:hypothetical protein
MGWRGWQNAKIPGPVRDPCPPASHLKILKIYIPAKYNYIKIFISSVFFI